MHLFRAQGRNAKVILFQTYRHSCTSLVFLCCSVFLLITLANKSLESLRGIQVLAVLRHFPEYPRKGWHIADINIFPVNFESSIKNEPKVIVKNQNRFDVQVFGKCSELMAWRG